MLTNQASDESGYSSSGAMSMHQANTGNDIRGLQERLAEARKPRPRRRRPPSRAALLAAIDVLSRWSGLGLALLAGCSVFLAVASSRAYPMRAIAWTLMIMAALFVCRRLHSHFRSGAAIAARPFHWRASYTAALSVLGVAFACAPVLLLPHSGLTSLAWEVGILSLLGAMIAAAFHIAHAPSAAALATPGVFLPLLAALRNGDSMLIFLQLGLASLGLGALFLLYKQTMRRLRRRHPRTSWVRREIDTPHGPQQRRPQHSQSAKRVG